MKKFQKFESFAELKAAFYFNAVQWTGNVKVNEKYGYADDARIIETVTVRTAGGKIVFDLWENVSLVEWKKEPVQTKKRRTLSYKRAADYLYEFTDKSMSKEEFVKWLVFHSVF